MSLETPADIYMGITIPGKKDCAKAGSILNDTIGSAVNMGMGGGMITGGPIGAAVGMVIGAGIGLATDLFSNHSKGC